MAETGNGYDIATAYIRIMPSTEKFGSTLKGTMESEGESAGGHFSSGFKTGLKILGAATAAAGAAVGKVVKDAVQEYAEYEQLVGGVQKLFGEMDYQGVVENAQEAFKTAGLSANDYMETVTNFSASLITSLKGDTKEAVNYADKAVRDMSDNANVFGTDISSIQDAYQGFAKQNYTMLDNLKLGYGGTKTEMERLIQDAENLDSSFKATRDENGNLAMSFSDIVDAIHIVQKEMKITGTTANEASTTIQGSVSSMQAAWHNLLIGLTDDSQDFGSLMGNLIETIVGVEDESGERVGGVINNIMPRVTQALEGLGTLIKEMIPELVGYIPEILSAVLPGLLESAGALVSAFLGELPNIIDVVAQELPGLLESLGGSIVTGLENLTEQLPTLADSLSGVLSSILTYIAEHADELISAVAEFLSTLLTEGIGILAENTTELVNALLAVIKAVIKAAIEHPELIAAVVGMKALKALGGYVTSAIGAGITATKGTIASSVKGAISGSSVAAGVGAGLGIAAAAAVVGVAIGGWITSETNLKRSNDDVSTSIMNLLDANKLLQESINNAKDAYDTAKEGADNNAAAAKTLYDRLLAVMKGYDGTAGKKELIQAMVDEINELLPGLGLTWDEYTNSLNRNSDQIVENIEMMKAQTEVAAAQELYIESLKQQAQASNEMAAAQNNLNALLARTGISLEDYNNVMADNEATGAEVLGLTLKYGLALGDTLQLYYDLNEANVGRLTATENYIDATVNATIAEQAYEEAVKSSNEAIEEHTLITETSTEEINNSIEGYIKQWNKLFTVEMPENLQVAIQAATDAGIEIPNGLIYGINGKHIEIGNAVNRMNELVEFNEAIETAGISGIEVSQKFIDSWLSGEFSLEEANAYYQSFVRFDTAIQNALESGRDVDESFVNGLLNQYGLAQLMDAADVLDETATPNTHRKGRARKAGNDTTSEYNEGVRELVPQTEDASNLIADAVTDTISEVPGEMSGYGSDAGEQFDTSFAGWNDIVWATVDDMYEIFYDALGYTLAENMGEWGTTAGERFDYWLGATDVSGTAQGIADAVTGAMSNLEWDMYNAGFNAGQGLYNGLDSWYWSLSDLAWSMANEINNAARSALDINSPSGVMMEIGEYSAEGVAIGLDKGRAEVLSSVEDMTNGMIRASSQNDLMRAMERSGYDYSRSLEELRMQETGDEGITDALGQIMMLLEKLSKMKMVTDTGALVGEMAEAMNQEFSAIKLREDRG